MPPDHPCLQESHWRAAKNRTAESTSERFLGGCLILTDTPPEVGTRLQLEVRDLPAGDARLEAEVAWRWRWEDSVYPARAGLRFLDAKPPEAILSVLGDPEFARELC